MKHGFRHQGRIRAAAIAQLPCLTVHTAAPGAEGTVDIIHYRHILCPIIAVFTAFLNQIFTPGEKCAMMINYKVYSNVHIGLSQQIDKLEFTNIERSYYHVEIV